MDVFDLYAKIDADISGFESGLNKAKDFGKNVLGGIGKVAKVSMGAIAGVGTAVTATTAAIVHATGGVAEYGDNIDKMSQKMGISAKGYQEWEAVMQHSGTSMETMKASMKTLANAVEGGNDAFSRIGLSMEQIKNMSNEEIFNATIEGLQNVENETERTYLAGQLLGKGATELGALLNTSAEDTQAMKDRVNELGGVMSDKAVKAAATYQDQLQDMKTAFSGLTRGMTSEFLPSITTVMDGLTDLFSGDETGIKKISQGFDEFVGNMTATLPQLLNTGSQIVTSLLGALSENLPQLVTAGVDAIKIIGKGLLDNAPMLITAIVQLGSQIASSLMSALEITVSVVESFDFASAAQNISDKMVSFFTGDGIQRFIESGMKLIGGLISGLGQALPSLIPAVVTIVYSLGNTLISNMPTIIDAGIQLIKGLATGIINAIPIAVQGCIKCWTSIFQIFGTYGGKIIDKVKEVFSKVVSTVVDFMQKLPERIAYFAGYALTKFILAWVNFPSKVAEILTKIIDKVKEWGDKLKNKGKEIAEGFGDFFKEGIDGLIAKVGEWGKSIGEKFINGIKSILNGASNIFSAFGEGAQQAGKEEASKQVHKVNSGKVGVYNITDENGFSTVNTSIDYDKLGASIVRAFVNADIKIECDDREFGRLVRKAVYA